MEKLQKILIDFEDLVNQEIDVDEILIKVTELKTQFNTELDSYNAEKLEEFLIDGGEEGNFVPEKLPEQAKYNDLVFAVTDRKQKKEEAIAQEYADNLKLKKSIITQLHDLIANEENIGKAFESFNTIREEWKVIGNVSSHEYKPLQAEYSNLLEAFFYNINIYKELKDHDLKRNLQLREELTAKMEALLEEKQIRQVQQLAGTLLSDWDEIGPTHKDDWTKVRDKFKTITKKVFLRIKNHFNEVKVQREKNLEEKQALIAKTEEIVNNEEGKNRNWKKNTEAILNIQKEWKKIGFATKKENEEIWEKFRGLCDTFFNEKGKFYEQAKATWDANKEKKQALITRAEALKESTDWKESTLQLKRLQDNWKKIGPASQKSEQQLWKQFRGACDFFFNAKKEWFDTLDDRLAGNLKTKQTFITSLAKVKLANDKDKDRATIKGLISDWEQLGQVPRDNVKDVVASFNTAIDDLYKQMGESTSIDTLRYEDKIESLAKRDRPENALLEEIQFIKGKIELLTKDKLQYENNLLFFGFSKGATADKMKDDVNKKIAIVNVQITGWDKKQRLVTKTLRLLSKAKEETAAKKEENKEA